MASVEDRELQRQYYKTVREEFAREGPATSLLMWLCRVLTFITPFGIRVNYSRKDGGPYQLRVYLTPKWISKGICLHHFFRSDQDEEYHNHPWFVGYSLILINGYLEHYLEKDTRRRLRRFFLPWSWNTLRNTSYERTWHRLELFQSHGAPQRPWSLFFHGRRIKDETDGVWSWGFLNADTLRYTGWKDFVNQPPSRHEKPVAVSDVEYPRMSEIDVAVDPDPTPARGTAIPATFDVEECPTTPIPAEILKEARDASVCAGFPSEPESRTCPTDPEGTP